jgi:hypothetical protein
MSDEKTVDRRALLAAGVAGLGAVAALPSSAVAADHDPQLKLGKAWAKIVAKSWADEDFKEKLLANPKHTLAEYGIDLDDDMKVYIADGASSWGIPLPPKPDTRGGLGADKVYIMYSSSIVCCSS